MSNGWPFSYEPESTTPSPEESPSPRTDLLSQGYDDTYEGALERPRRSSTSTRRGPGERFKRERERVHSGTPKRDLVKALINEEYESKQTRRVLYKAYDQYQNETKRATEAEGRALEAAQRYRVLNEAKIIAQQEAARLKEELRLYKLQLENAQMEIHKAQDVLSAVENQRDDAEASAARARDTARKLHEARMVEQAREEGRRLGFEEGIRRGKEMGFEDGRETGYDNGRDDMREVAMDRGDGGGYEGSGTPTASPPRVLATPEFVGPPSLPPKDRGSIRSRKISGASRSSRQPGPSEQAPVPEPLPFSPPARHVPVRNSAASPRHQDVLIPPDNWIPTANQEHFIAIPPPHELSRTPEQSFAGDADSLLSRNSRNSRINPSDYSPSVRARDFAFDPPQNVPQRPNSLDSQGSTNHSKTSTTISKMDLVTPPHTVRNPARRNLSVIPEDGSSGQPSPNASIRDRSMNPERMPFPPMPPPDFAAAVGDRGMDSPAQLAEARARDKRMNQKMADELRYSDPSQVEEWRRSGADRAHSLSSQEAPPRRRPNKVTVPSPLSPHGAGPSRLNDQPHSHRRTRSMASTSSQSLNVPGSRDFRRSTSSGSTVPEITIQPPSRPPSDYIDQPAIGARDLLSPDHAHNPLPPTNYSAPRRSAGPPPQPVPTVPNSPVIPDHIFRVLPDGNLPPGFTPIGPSNPLPPTEVPQTNETIPIPIPPPFSSSYAPASGPYAASPLGRSRELYSPKPPQGHLPSDVPRPTFGDTSRTRTPRPNIYAASAVPVGGPYPYPQSSGDSMPRNSALRQPGSSMGSQSTNSPGHRRSVSLNAGQTPGAMGKSTTLPGRSVTPQPSDHSLGSGKRYSHYDPSSHLDPAFLASNGPYRPDPATEANTFANANSRLSGSPALSYGALPSSYR